MELTKAAGLSEDESYGQTNQVQAKQQMLRFLKPEFLESFSESCEIDTP
jgi:hypothetical protein